MESRYSLALPLTGQCFLMKLAFEDAPLSFAEPMVPNASTRKVAKGRVKETSPHRSTTRTQVREVERVQAVGTAPNQVPPRRQIVM